jgi:hypothetical protein
MGSIRSVNLDQPQRSKARAFPAQERPYRFWEFWIDVMVMNGKGQPCPEAPPPVKDVDTPEKLIGPKSLLMIVELGKVHLATMQSHFERCSGRQADGSPGENFFVAIELENALWIC